MESLPQQQLRQQTGAAAVAATAVAAAAAACCTHFCLSPLFLPLFFCTTNELRGEGGREGLYSVIDTARVSGLFAPGLWQLVNDAPLPMCVCVRVYGCVDVCVY